MIQGLDLDEKYVRDFIRRIGYFLAAEHAAMPDGLLRDTCAEYANDFMDMLATVEEQDQPPPPALERVK